MQNALTWFEIPVRDMKRAKQFYENALQIEMSDMAIGPVKLSVFPATEVSGALIEEPNYVAPVRGTVVYLNTIDSIDAVLDRIKSAGGEIVTPRTLIQEDVGWSAAFRDLDGNGVGLYESAQQV